MSNYHLDLYNRIRDALPFFCKEDPKSQDGAAIEIYLVAIGVRPTCLPFPQCSYGDEEVESEFTGEGGKQEYARKHPEVMDGLRAIKEIEVVLGPFESAKDEYIIANKKMWDSGEIPAILEERRSIDAKMAAGVDSEEHQKLFERAETLKANMLGYFCVWNELQKNPQPAYFVQYIIKNTDGQESYGNTFINIFCEMKTDSIEKALEMLGKMNDALKQINKMAILQISIDEKFFNRNYNSNNPNIGANSNAENQKGGRRRKTRKTGRKRSYRRNRSGRKLW
jgi:hypothetical protein